MEILEKRRRSATDELVISDAREHTSITKQRRFDIEEVIPIASDRTGAHHVAGVHQKVARCATQDVDDVRVRRVIGAVVPVDDERERRRFAGCSGEFSFVAGHPGRGDFVAIRGCRFETRDLCGVKLGLERRVVTLDRETIGAVELEGCARSVVALPANRHRARRDALNIRATGEFEATCRRRGGERKRERGPGDQQHDSGQQRLGRSAARVHRRENSGQL